MFVGAEHPHDGRRRAASSGLHEIENLYVELTRRAIASSLEQGVDAELIIRDRSHRGAGGVLASRAVDAGESSSPWTGIW